MILDLEKNYRLMIVIDKQASWILKKEDMAKIVEFSSLMKPCLSA